MLSKVSKLIGSFFLIVIVSANAYSQDFKPTLPEIDSISIMASSKEVQDIITKKIDILVKKNAPAILLARHYNILGELFYHNSDIGEASNYWIKSYNLLKKQYGENSIYMAENYALLSRYNSFRINIDSAFYYSNKAIEICRSKQDSVKFIKTSSVYREFAYALKIKYIKEGKYLEGTKLARCYYDSARKFNSNTIKELSLLQDIGNTFNDEIIYFERKKDSQNAYKSLKSANFYYDKAISQLSTVLSPKNDKVASLYHLKGLSYLYCFKYDSLMEVLEYYQKGLVAATNDFQKTSITSFPNPNSKFVNSSIVLILFRFKIDALYFEYTKTKNIEYLKNCYLHSKAAVELWYKEFEKIKSKEIHQALEIYGQAPFASSIPYACKYYQLTKKDDVAQNVFKWMDLNKYSVLIKHQIQNGQLSLESKITSVSEIQLKLKENEAIIEYYYNPEGLVCAVLTKESFNLYPINSTFKTNQSVDSLLGYLKKHKSEEFCKTSKLLFDSILNPFIKNLKTQVTHLIIIPHDKLLLLPFDAMVLNKTNSYKDADFLIKHFEVSLGLSCNLLFNDNQKTTINKKLEYVSPTFIKYSNLPFSDKLIDYLKSDFDISPASFNKSPKENNAILHLATHAFCDYNNSRNSYFLLSDENKMYLHDLTSMNFQSPLAILSACETGNGNIELGEGVINFSRQFYLAGIKSSITTLWKVDDQATADILKMFYQELLRGYNSIASLHNAKLSYLKAAKSIDDYDPYYWSGLIYTGSPISLQDNSIKNILNWVIGLTVFGLLLLFLRRKFF